MATERDSLLREVDEELRRDQFQQIWEQYGTYIIGAVAALLIGVGGYKWWDGRQAAAAEAAGLRFEQALNLAETGNADEALKSFADDCKAMGIWQNCVVAVISEFGRRNFENGSSGTDHGGASCMLLTGGAVIGGEHGVAPTDQDLLQSVLPYAVDFRAVYAQILGEHLGLADPTSVFSEAFTSPVGVNVV